LLIKVRFFAHLRNVAGTRELEVNTQSGRMDVESLMHLLFKKLGEDFRKAVQDPKTGKIQPYIKIMLNGIDTEQLNGLETAVKDGDTVQIFPPIGGG
jgi:molybdopterin synthase sulfur carrier subunit